MSEPIINPWLIYWIGRVDNLRLFLVICLIAGVVLFLYQSVKYIDDDDLMCLTDETYRAKKHNKKKKLRAASFFLLVVLVAETMMPSSNTLVKMWIASKVTPAQIHEASVVTAELAQKALDLITDSAIKILQESKK